MLCFLAGLVGAAFVDRRQVFAKLAARKRSRDGRARPLAVAVNALLRAMPSIVAASALLATLGSARPAHACGEAVSRCASLETALPPSAPSRFFALHSLEPLTPESDAATRSLSPLFFSAQAHYQRRPLIAQAPSPDPFGREVPLLMDWLTVSALATWQFQQRWALGVALPLSLPLSGSGLDGIASQRSQAPAALSLGDPDLVGHLRVLSGPLRLALVQRLSLPLGSTESFLRHNGPRYAPTLAASWDLGASTFGLELGARLRRRETLADTSFGSEAWFALGITQRLPFDLSVAAEAWALPSLTRDEQRFLDGSTARLHRVASEWLVSLAWQAAQRRFAVGVGSSLPLSVREAAESERFAGPPGPTLRLSVRVEQRF